MTLSRVSFFAALPIASAFAFSSPVQSATPSESIASAVSEPLLLCAPGQQVVQKDGLGMYATPRGLTLLPVTAGQPCKLLATGAGLNVQFPGQSALPLAGPVNYRLNQSPRSAELSVVEPILCESYYAQADRLALQLTDTNGVSHVLRGFAGLRYSPAMARFVPEPVAGTYGPAVQCHGFLSGDLTANPPSVPLPPVVDPNRIFASGFDDGANLKLEILTGDGALAIRELEVALDQPFTYQIRLTNTGAVAASGVRVREFVPTAAGQSLIEPIVTAQGWTCSSSEGACAGGASGMGALSQTGLTLAAGEVRTYTLIRQVSSGAPPQRTLLAAALFFNPEDAVGGGDRVQTDNSAPLILKLVPNQAPQFACSYPDRTFAGEPIVWSNNLPVAVTMDEGDAAVEFECRVRDTDGDAFTLAADPDNDNPALISNDGLITQLAADRFDVRIQVPSNQIGSGLVTQSATDARDGTGRVRINVEVRDVNSPPSFALKGSVIEVPNGPGLPRILNRQGQWEFLDVPDVSFGTGCDGNSTCVMSLAAFLEDRSIGDGPELPQTLTPSISCTLAGSGSAFLEPASWAVTPAGANSVATEISVGFKYRRSGFAPSPTLDSAANCTVTLTDSGSPPESFSAPLVIRYIQP